MPNELRRFSDGIFDKPIEIHSPAIDSVIRLDRESYNMLSGIYKGTGPRQGMSPIPYHSINEVPSSGQYPGLMRGENAANHTANVYELTRRKKIFGVTDIPLKPFNSLSSPEVPTYIWIMSSGSGGGSERVLHVVANSQLVSGRPNYISGIKYGFQMTPYNLATSTSVVVSQLIGLPTISGSNMLAAMQKALFLDTTKNYFSFSRFISSEKNIPQKWYIGEGIGTADSTHSETAQYTFTGYDYNTPEFISSQRIDTNLLVLKAYNLSSTQLEAEYVFNNLALTTSIVDSTNLRLAINGTAATSLIQRLDGVAPTYANIQYVLAYDEKNFTKSGYKSILVACGKPAMFMFQEWLLRDTSVDYLTSFPQVFDLSNRRPRPDAIRTLNEGVTAGTFYKEDGKEVATCWHHWPSFVRGTPIGTSSGSAFDGLKHIRTGPAGSGVLRKDTVYEFAFSFYSKIYDVETNVGTPAKIQIGSDDFVAITFYRDRKSAGVFVQEYADPTHPAFFTGGANNNHLERHNYDEIRIYYRAEGSYEWLPALFIDGAQYRFDPNKKELWGCTGDIAALPGGQEGGFIDYSTIQSDTYDCVLTYKQRAFWFSKKSAVFSLRDNVFCYPKRNYQAIPSGEFRGAIIHNFPGQAEQQSRLIVFGSEENYIGRFTGVRSQASVRVSPDTIATFEVDGSDFLLESWTRFTAFSYRSAVVAEGHLYYWGPQGVFRDDGVDVPNKISNAIEPELMNFYDPQKIDEIHCHFDSKTREITWFYPPKTSDGFETHMLVYSVVSRQFKFAKADGKIDWAQDLNISDLNSPKELSGPRTIIGVREDGSAEIQRAVFYDHNNRSGDVFPKTELMIKTVTTPSSGVRRLTLASGYDATNLSTISINDIIAVHQASKYNTSVVADDLIARISAIDTGSGTIDITLPSDGSLDNIAITDQTKFFPIWHRGASSAGLNGIRWNIKTRYWEPEGPNMFWFWQWLYLRFRVNLWSGTSGRDFSVSYRTPTSGNFVTDTITLLNNSDNHCQILHPFRIADTNNQGQAIQFNFFGYHIGHEWVLEYLEAHASEQRGYSLKQFEG